MIPSSPGLEIFMPHESASSNGNRGATVRAAIDGSEIISIYGEGDIGRGVAGDIDPNSPGFEYWATTSDPGPYAPKVYDSQGQVLYDAPSNMFYNFLVWWDADLTRELLDRTTISEWNNPGRSNFDLVPGTGGTQQFAPGASDNNDSKHTPALTADIFGDWREEVIWRANGDTELRIFTTIISANNRLVTLMHDTQYREAIAWQNVGYNQPPHPSFFLGAGMDDPPTPLVFYPGLDGDYNDDGTVNFADYTVWRDHLGDTVDLTADGDHSGVVDIGDYEVWKNNFGAVASVPSASTLSLATEGVNDAKAPADALAGPVQVATALSESLAEFGDDEDPISEMVAIDSQLQFEGVDADLLLLPRYAVDSEDASECDDLALQVAGGEEDRATAAAAALGWESVFAKWGEA